MPALCWELGHRGESSEVLSGRCLRLAGDMTQRMVTGKDWRRSWGPCRDLLEDARFEWGFEG